MRGRQAAVRALARGRCPWRCGDRRAGRVLVRQFSRARRELAAAGDADALRKQLMTEYDDTLANPYLAAERGFVDAVIEPAQTRLSIMKAFRSLRNKRVELPPRKHGNIPL